MGIKILIAQACVVLASGAEQVEHADVGDTVEVSKEDALSLARLGRAYFSEKSDDPTKGRLTAGKEEVDLVKKQAKAIAEDLKQREIVAQAQSPAGMAAMVAAAVAQAVQAALAKPATA